MDGKYHPNPVRRVEIPKENGKKRNYKEWGMGTMGNKRIGFIGLGAMGLPMARNLLKNDFEVHVAVHRNSEPVQELKGQGAVVHDSLEHVAAGCEVLISILPADMEMQNVLLDAKLLDALNGDAVLVEMTSGSPAMMKRVHDVYRNKGIRVLDAPVSGGTIGAEKGTLTVMAGGEADVLDDVRRVLEAMAGNIYLVGSVGAGKAIKAINQMLAGVHMVAAAEAFALAQKLEIDKDILKQVIGSSSGASWMFLNKVDAMSDRNFKPGFKQRLMKKDVQIAVDEGRNIPLPLAGLALQLYNMTEKDIGEKDFSAIAEYFVGDE
ncbi:NAD(P)-binding domain-containing protein [uncultured Paenibacillus sp.]|uniref:NAD(P)-dependent oxidoreductase n=1 Tax=uncultured Paenibacillus sp. TaxID=227322 RepID=UPI0028D62DEB|nr:NAD(P)-binding domain-containing protein [uncultured Paenibacillus sp.]